MLYNLPKSIKFVNTDFNHTHALLTVLDIYRNKTFVTDFNLEELDINEKEELDDSLKLNKNKLIYSNYRLQDNYYKPEGELENYCYNCTSNDGVNFNNEIEKMYCIMCKETIKNENSIIQI
jgi:hypothetical protein